MVNPLFPATVKNHATLGLGWQFSPANEFNASLVVAPTTTVTNGDGVKVSHRQASAQLMYTHRF
jgi:long-chain fatty acid transport protein